MSEDLPEAPPPAGVTPELIMQLGTSFMATRHLIAAADVGVFEALGDDVLGLEALAAKIAIPRRTARICADAMVALGLLERDGDLYRNSPAADAFLSGRGPGDLRPFLRYLDVSYRAWAEFTGAIRAGQGSGFITRLDSEAQRLFSAGVESATAGSAIALAENYQFGQHRRLLDLGGGTGSFLARILERHPAIECGLFDLPHVVVMARENLSAQAPGSRVRFYEGDLLRDQLPTGYDAFLLANLIHVFTPEHNRGLLERVHASALPGARLLLVDFWTDPTHTQPVFAALMAGEWLMGRGQGDVYSEDEICDLLTATGWRMTGSVASDRPGEPHSGRAAVTAEYVYNFVGEAEQIIESAEPLPTGHVIVSASFGREGDSMPAEGTLTLHVGDKEAEHGRIKTQPGKFSIAGEGLNIGKDGAEPVTDDYPGQAPWSFTGGTIVRAAVDVRGEPFVDLAAEARMAFMRDCVPPGSTQSPEAMSPCLAIALTPRMRE